MSALDQALTKAYAKNRSPATASLLEMPAADGRQPAAAPRASAANAVERIYHDGALYRVEAHGVVKRSTSAVQPPHLKMLPPTSPRRTVRRSMLRLLASHQTTGHVEPQEPPPRVARKVIIRHISHSAAPPPLGLLRAGTPAPRSSYAELTPEIFSDEPSPAPMTPAKPDPAPLNVAPLNIAIEATPPIEVHGDWNHEAALAPMMLIGNSEKESPWAVVSVELDALADLERAAHRDVEISIAAQQEKSFAAKTLDDSEEPRMRFRLDAAHPAASPAPHAKFAAAPVEEVPEEEVDEPHVAPSVTSSVIPEETPPNLDEIQLVENDLSELTFAEPSAEPLASDLILPADDEDVPAPALESSQEQSASTRPASPLWEVDKFHWPRTCEKLFADEQGYLSRAGDKLLAAVQDGLRVLAITGTRRGEGRTTLALCLARAAAQAGVQVAVMDADFARPQLATKIALEVAFGWQDAALGRIPLSEAAVKSIHDRVTVLPLESAAATRALSLADPRVTATIRAAAATFELLILDMGPLGPSEQLAFPQGEECPFDAAIVVRDLRFATATESETVGEALHDIGVEAVGIAENFVIEDEIPATSV